MLRQWFVLPFCQAVTNLPLGFSLSSSDDESDAEPKKKKKNKEEEVDKKDDEDEDEDEDEEMEKQLAELKAEEFAELKRYVMNILMFIINIFINNKYF